MNRPLPPLLVLVGLGLLGLAVLYWTSPARSDLRVQVQERADSSGLSPQKARARGERTEGGAVDEEGHAYPTSPADSEAAVISGVVQWDTGDPISGAEVRASSVSRAKGFDARTLTNARGEFSIGVVRGSMHDVVAVAGSHEGTRHIPGVMPPADLLIQFNRAGGELIVHVTPDHTRGVIPPDTELELWLATAGWKSQFLGKQSVLDGTLIRFQGLQPGRYVAVVRGEDTGRAEAWVKTGGSVELRLALTASRSLSCTVLDADSNAPIPGCRVVCVGTVVPAGVTDAQGIYVTRLPEMSDATLEFLHPGYAMGIESLRSDQTVLRIGLLRGRFLRVDLGSPVGLFAKTAVRLDEVQGERDSRAAEPTRLVPEVQSEHVEFADLTPGRRYRVVACCPEQELLGVADVAESADRVAVVLDAARRIFAVVEGPTGEAVAHADVVCQVASSGSRAERFSLSGVADREGHLTLLLPHDSRAIMWAEHPFFARSDKRQLDSNRDTVVALRLRTARALTGRAVAPSSSDIRDGILVVARSLRTEETFASCVADGEGYFSLFPIPEGEPVGLRAWGKNLVSREVVVATSATDEYILRLEEAPKMDSYIDPKAGRK